MAYTNDELQTALESVQVAIQNMNRDIAGVGRQAYELEQEFADNKKLQTSTGDAKVRVNIKQTSKGDLYYDITCRGDSVEETIALIKETKAAAENQCRALEVPQ